MKKTRIIVMVVSILSGYVVAAQNTMLSFPKDGWYRIRITQTGQYLSIENASRDNGAKLVPWDYEGKFNQQFQVKKNPDGTYSFFAKHSNKSLCADKGDGREGDIIIQNTLSQYFGKWNLDTIQRGCGGGFRIRYFKGDKPLQLSGGGFALVEQQYQDAALDCSYTYIFEPVDAPAVPKETIQRIIPKTNFTRKKTGN